MATDAEKVKMYREKAKDTSVPQEVRNTYLDRANELERKAFEATKVPEKKMAVGGVAFRGSGPLDGGVGVIKDKTKPVMPTGMPPKPRPTPKPQAPVKPRAPVKPVKVQNKPKPFTAPYPQVSPTAIDGPNTSVAMAKGGMPVRGSRTATNKAKKMMGGGYAMPAKTSMMAKGGAVKAPMTKKAAPAKKGK